jgi:hypothetical protein
MKKVLPVIVVIMMIGLTGCTIRNTRDITERLQPTELYVSYEIKPANLKARSKCPSPPTVNIVTVETREDDYVFFNPPGLERTVNPKELTSAIVEYLNDGFRKSKIEVKHDSSKIIHIAFEDAKTLRGFWTVGGEIKMKVDIPETNYSEIYEAKDWVYGDLLKALAGAAHIVTRKIIDDPVIQDYILCR